MNSANERDHIPVLPAEITEFCPTKPETVFDLTFGRGGHAELILERYPKVHYHAVDLDADSSLPASQLQERYANFRFHNLSFEDFIAGMVKAGIKSDFIIADLGISSYQLDEASRGFSFNSDAPLDMRMSKLSGNTAERVVNSYSAERLKRIFREFGEQENPGFFAKKIVERRDKTPFTSGRELGDFIRDMHPYRYKLKVHPATKIFMAIRLEVNQELERLKNLLEFIPDALSESGIAAFITFHSLEDRLVKQKFKTLCLSCVCPLESPICVCGGVAKFISLTRKPVIAGTSEAGTNPRSRSAKLRVIQKNQR